MFSRLLSRNHWLARLLNLPVCSDNASDTGLILIQIDGLSMKQFQSALSNRRMPFLNHLLKKKSHTLWPGYSGLPSSTPAYQAELMYGIKSFVPAFEFIDRRTAHRHVSYKPESANQLAQELSARGKPLLNGGNAYATLFSGGAKEARYCSETMDLDSLLNTLNPLKLILLFLLHAGTVLRIAGYALIECGLAIFDFFRGVFSKKNIFKEFAFVPARVAVCIILRELVRFRLKLDVARDVPLLYANFLGYDEQAHRRGPDSAFAHWSLKGIDQTIQDIHKTAVRSECRSYQMIIYSDHGQERVDNYEAVFGRTVKNAIRKEFNALYPDLFIPDEIRITTMGPIGHIYLPERITEKNLGTIAEKLAANAGIPLVFFKGANEILGCDHHGIFRVSENAERILGADHPFPDRILKDLEAICRHKNAGDLVISGWRPSGTPLSFNIENGAHGGFGKNETHPFLLIPAELICDQPPPVLRASDLRQLVQNRRFYPGQESAGTTKQGKADKIIKSMTWTAAAGILLIAALSIIVYREQFLEYWQRLQNGETHPAGLIAAYVVLPMVGFPITPLLVLLGVRFGSLYGSIIMVLIMPVHLAVSYWAVRTRIQGWIERLAVARSVSIPRLPKRHRFSFSFLFMAVPGLSYTLKNYLLPMSGLSFGLFMICGWLPQAALGIPFVVMGAAAAQYSLILLGALAVIYIVMIVSRKWIARFYQKIASIITHSKNKGDDSK